MDIECTSTDHDNGHTVFDATAYEAVIDSILPRETVREQESASEKFQRLAEEWRENRPWGADITELCIQPAYQAIIGMGDAAIPYILRELRNKPDHWFWALNAIVADDSVDPIPEESQGKLLEMAQAWIDWGRRNDRF